MNKKVISWIAYDWANSVFFTTVMAGFFPVFFKKYWAGDASSALSTERLGWILAGSGFLLAVLSPLLGVISDFRRRKKAFLFGFMLVGTLGTFGLYFVPQGDWLSAALLYGAALFCCSASCIFYDSLLVSVTTPERYDSVSTIGYAWGYLGGALLFAVNVMMFQKPEFFGLSSGTAGVKLSFVIVGVWWFIFTMPLMLNVPEPPQQENKDPLFKLLKKSVLELKKTSLEIVKQKNLFYFLLAYWFYIDGVSTVMAMAVDFGIMIGFDSGVLIQALLLTQFVAFPSSYLAGKFAGHWGNKNVIIAGLGIYVVVLVGSALMVTAAHFYLLAALVGMAQGTVQALSRSLFAALIPKEKAGEYFGFFNLLGKFASVMGPVLIAMAARFTEGSQKTMLSLLILFIAGIYFLLKVNPEPVRRAPPHKLI